MEQPTAEWRRSEIKRLEEHVARIEERMPAYQYRGDKSEMAERARQLAADLKLNIKTHKRELRRERNG